MYYICYFTWNYCFLLSRYKNPSDLIFTICSFLNRLIIFILNAVITSYHSCFFTFSHTLTKAPILAFPLSRMYQKSKEVPRHGRVFNSDDSESVPGCQELNNKSVSTKEWRDVPVDRPLALLSHQGLPPLSHVVKPPRGLSLRWHWRVRFLPISETCSQAFLPASGC